MTNYKEIIRMHANNFSNRAIAQSLHSHRETVKKCLEQATLLGLSYPFEREYTNEELKELLFPQFPLRNTEYVLPNFEQITEELKKPSMTLTLLWYRYIAACRASGEKFYQQTQFFELYSRYRKEHNIVTHMDTAPGEILEIDWAGDSLYIYEPIIEQRIKVSLFVAAFSYSGYFYTEAFLNQKVHSWIQAHDNALQFFGGVPLILKPDNTKTAVIKPDRYEPQLNEAYLEFSEHYGTVIIPARVKRPRDKAVVEGTVGFVTRRIIADLYGQKFFSLNELNQAIWERMDLLNAHPFTKKPGSRQDFFLTREKKALLPLPPTRFTLFERKTATVAPDCYIQFNKSFYSVPYKMIGNNVTVKASSDKVIIVHPKKGIIATHARSTHPGQRMTLPEHLPKYASEYSSWNGASFRRQAAVIGPQTLAIIEQTLISREYEVQSYRSCVGILQLQKKYGSKLLESACMQALDIGIRSRKGIKSLLTMMIAEADPHPEIQVDPLLVDELEPYYYTHSETKTNTPQEDPHDV